MSLCNTTQTWVKNLKVGETHKQYVVQLKRQIRCCGLDKYQIFVNGEEIDHQLKDNPCSPLCCPGGKYEWQVDGHYFLIMYNSLSFTANWGNHRLFIDGLDCNTEREFSAFWRRRGWQYLIFGFCCALIGAILALVVHYALKNHVRSKGMLLWFAYFLFITGVIFMFYGVIPILRFKKPLTYQNVNYNTTNDALNQV